jgi:hypothetical protein
MKEQVKEVINNEAAKRFPTQQYIEKSGSKLLKQDYGVFVDGAEFGYSLAIPEIEALKKEVDILRKYKSLSEEILSKVPCGNGEIHQSNLYLFGFKNAVRELKEFKQANKL